MKKVICIVKPVRYGGLKPYWYSPDVGDILEVISVKCFFGDLYYELAGYSEFLYDADCFAEIQDQPAEITEKEIVNLQPA